MHWLKQSTAVTLKIGPFIDETDGKTAETGLTIAQADVRLSKNGGNIAQKNESTSCTHDELGIYGCPLDTTDTATLGRLQLWVHESGALPVWHEFMVVPANVWDSFFGADMLKVDVHSIDDDETAANNLELITEIANITSLTVDAAGHLEANVVEIEGADPTDTIRDAVVDDATRIDASALNTLSGHDPGGTLCADATPLTAAETESEVNDALVALKLDHLIAVAESDEPVDNSILAKMAASDGNWSGFSAAADSLEALRNRGDAAWITGGGDATEAKQDAIITDLDDIKGTGFVKDTDSLVDLAHTGADADTLETLSDQLDDVATLGSGAITFTYTLTSSVDSSPIASATVWVTTDQAGSNVVASGTTNTSGEVTFYLDTGTYYVWREKSGWNFTNPDTETVS